MYILFLKSSALSLSEYSKLSFSSSDFPGKRQKLSRLFFFPELQGEEVETSLMPMVVHGIRSTHLVAGWCEYLKDLVSRIIPAWAVLTLLHIFQNDQADHNGMKKCYFC